VFAASRQTRDTVTSRMLMEHYMLHFKYISVRTLSLLKATAHRTELGFISRCAEVTCTHVTHYVMNVQEHSVTCMNLLLIHSEIHPQ
jgi:hypothetical protein